MKVNLKASRNICGVSYPKGVVQIPDKVAKNWYFLALIANKEATWVQKPGQPETQAAVAQQQKLKPMPTNALRPNAPDSASAISSQPTAQTKPPPAPVSAQGAVSGQKAQVLNSKP